MPAPLKSAEEIQAFATEFMFVRIQYSDSGNPQSLSAWATDYPEAEVHFSRQVEQRLGLNVNPSGVVLPLTSPTLPDYPLVYLVEGGRLALTDEEVVALRSYLEGGGMIIFDDFWREQGWASLERQLKRVFPDRESVRLWGDHEIFYTFYPVNDLQAVPGLSEIMSVSDSRPLDNPVYRGILADDGRVMAIMLQNMDFGDAWEHSGDDIYPPELAAGAVAMGINIVAYALTH
jgi:hypothetical protein